MADEKFSVYANTLTEQTTIDGNEFIVAIDVATALHVTPDLLAAYTIDKIHGATPTTTLSDAYKLPVFDASNDEETITFAYVSDWIVDELEALPITTPIATDYVIYSDNGILKRGLVSVIMGLAEADALNFSTLDTKATPAAGDNFVIDDNDPKRTTVAEMEALFYADFATYFVNETYQSTVTGSDQMYMVDSGTVKYTTVDDLKTYIGVNAGDVTGPTTPTTNYVPQWNGTGKLLDDGFGVLTEVSASGLDTKLVTEKGIREAITAGGVMTALVDIGADLVDADLFMVDDGPGGVTDKSEVVRIWTYIEGKLQAAPAKDPPIDADIILIQDSAASNAVSEVTCLNMKEYMGISDLNTTAGAGIAGVTNSSFISSVENIGTMFRTTIVIDLAGLNSSATANHIIGDDGTGAAHLGEITAAVNGTIFAGRVECLEVPGAGDTDIDLQSADEPTGVEDTAIGDLSNDTKLINHGAWTANQVDSLDLFPAAGQHLYLTAGTGSSATYTTGIFVITLWGK